MQGKGDFSLPTHPVGIKGRFFCRNKGSGNEEVLKLRKSLFFTYDLQICQNTDVGRNACFLLLHGKHEIEATILYDLIDKSRQNW
jgi:hypothetical protein